MLGETMSLGEFLGIRYDPFSIVTLWLGVGSQPAELTLRGF